MVRQARIEDFSSIAMIHMMCFPGTVTARLGKLWKGKLLVKYYITFFEDCPELFLVAENEIGGIVGYCMGFRQEKQGLDKQFTIHNLGRLSLGVIYLLLKGDKVCWRKLFSFFKLAKNEDSCKRIIAPLIDAISDENKVQLFTICVADGYRGKTYGKDLIIGFFDLCQKLSREICLISYSSKNFRAENFYYKYGCLPYLEIGQEKKICYKRILW